MKFQALSPSSPRFRSARPRAIYSLIAVLLISGFVLPSAALADWANRGPEGGDVKALVQDGDGALYATLERRGLYRSTNRGASWTRIAGLGGRFGFDLAIDSSGEDAAVYVATDRGIVRVERQGAGWSWEALETGLPNADALVVIVDPDRPELLLAGFAGGEGMYRSIDRGASWQSLNEPFEDLLFPWIDVRAMLFNPHDSSEIHAYIGSIIFSSSDDGETWEEITMLFGDPVEIAFDSQDPQTLYTADEFQRFQVSRDGGETWELFFFPQTEDPLYFEGGASLAVDPLVSGRFWIGTTTGRIFLIEDFGNDVRVLPVKNLTPSPVHALLVDHDDRRRLYAGTGGPGVLVSGNFGAAWKARNRGLDGLSTRVVRFHPNKSEVIFAGTQGGVFKSTDRGSTWQALSKGLIGSDVLDLEIDPNNPDRMYVATSKFFHLSTNGGKLWRHQPTPPFRDPRSLTIDPRDSSIIYMGTEAGIRRSVNFGKKFKGWSGPDRYRLLRRNTDVLLIDETGRLTVPRKEGVMRSLPDTETWFWTAQDFGTGRVIGLAQAPSDRLVLYASVQLDGVYHSRDGGFTWQASETGGFANRRVRSFAVDPEDAETVYALTWDHGIDRSTDGGLTWNSLGLAEKNLRIYSLEFDPEDRTRLYASTDYGIFYLDLP